MKLSIKGREKVCKKLRARASDDSRLRVNPRRACARVTVVAVCVYPSVTALAASASV